MRKLGAIAALVLGATLSASEALPCTNLFVYAPQEGAADVAVVGRVLDLESNLGWNFGYGQVGDENTSDVNATAGRKRALTWTTRYRFLGPVAETSNALYDGMNTEGVYGAFLYLPGVTQYPEFDPASDKKVLGVAHLVNYVLGTCSSVAEAYKQLQSVQIVLNAIMVQGQAGQAPFAMADPLHAVFRDRHGHSLVIEWIDGKSIFYYDGPDAGTLPSPGRVLTNSPPLNWQLANAKQPKYTKLFVGNTSEKWDGLYMNGSGMVGVPGDYTPVHRFVRATTFVNSAPTPKTQTQGVFLAQGILDTVLEPLFGSASPTLWGGIADLQNRIYNFLPLFDINQTSPPGAKGPIKYNIKLIEPPPGQRKWIALDLTKITSMPADGFASLTKNWLSARVTEGPRLSEKQVADIKKMVKQASPPNITAEYSFVPSETARANAPDKTAAPVAKTQTGMSDASGSEKPGDTQKQAAKGGCAVSLPAQRRAGGWWLGAGVLGLYALTRRRRKRSSVPGGMRRDAPAA
jgi:MYXO-CTERM domain-containing protein